MRSLPIAFLAFLAPLGSLAAQIPPGHLVISAMRAGSSAPTGSLAVLDPGTGQVGRITWPLAVILDFEDVLVEPGTGNLFVASAVGGLTQHRLEYWQMSGLTMTTAVPLHTFSSDIQGMCIGPGGDLYVLVGSPLGVAPPGLWRVDPRGATAAVQVETWSATQGFPYAVCSDGTDLYVVCGSSMAIVSLRLWRVPPGGGKRAFPTVTPPPAGIPTDIDYLACGQKLWISLATGETVHFAIGGASYRTHSNLGRGATAANCVPSLAGAYFAGLDPTAPAGSVAVTRIGIGGTQRFPIGSLGTATGLHSDPIAPGYHGEFAAYPVGYACTGSGGRAPRLDHQNGPPDLGNRSFALTLHSTLASQPALLLIGASDRSWGALTLPFDLAPLGAPSGCQLLASGEVQLGATLVAAQTLVPTPIPCDPSLLEARAFLQFLAYDPGIAPLPVIASNGASVVLR